MESLAQRRQAIRAFWEERAALGTLSGTPDFLLTQVEQTYLLDHVPLGSRVLELGSGSGHTLIRLAREQQCECTGFDYSPGMVRQAQEHVLSAGLSGRISIFEHSLPALPADLPLFDVVISNRCLNSLVTPEEQQQVIHGIASLLKPGGLFLMLENTLDGLETTNRMRQAAGLDTIDEAWHSRFFRVSEVNAWQQEGFRIEHFAHVTSLYYFLSRVINAKLCAQTGEALAYDALINQIAASLPQQVGDFGPVKAWHWRKQEQLA